jgi:hypothetical protein
MIVVDWLVEVHQKFRLEPATLHLCVSILDRYLSVEEVERSKLQLVGVTSLLLACKYEEIYPPLVKDCVYITDKAYTHQDILDMESHILYKLNFQLSAPTSYPFMQRFLVLLDASPTMETASNYYMDRVLQEHDFLKYRPSMVAAAAVCLAVNNPDVRFNDAMTADNPGVVSPSHTQLLHYQHMDRPHTLFCTAKFSVGLYRIQKRRNYRSCRTNGRQGCRRTCNCFQTRTFCSQTQIFWFSIPQFCYCI